MDSSVAQWVSGQIDEEETVAAAEEFTRPSEVPTGTVFDDYTKLFV